MKRALCALGALVLLCPFAARAEEEHSAPWETPAMNRALRDDDAALAVVCVAAGLVIAFQRRRKNR